MKARVRARLRPLLSFADQVRLASGIRFAYADGPKGIDRASTARIFSFKAECKKYLQKSLCEPVLFVSGVLLCQLDSTLILPPTPAPSERFKNESTEVR